MLKDFWVHSSQKEVILDFFSFLGYSCLTGKMLIKLHQKAKVWIYKTLSGAEDAIEFSDPINMTYFCLFGGLKREESSYRILVRGRGLHKKVSDIHNRLKTCFWPPLSFLNFTLKGGWEVHLHVFLLRMEDKKINLNKAPETTAKLLF